jgi:hypothetical protein
MLSNREKFTIVDAFIMLISVAEGWNNPLPYRYACFWSSSFLNFGILQDDTYLRVGNVCHYP